VRAYTSVVGHSRPNWAVRVMSGLPPVATVERTSLHFVCVPYGMSKRLGRIGSSGTRHGVTAALGVTDDINAPERAHLSRHSPSSYFQSYRESVLLGLDLIFFRSGRRNGFEFRSDREATKVGRSRSNGVKGAKWTSLWLQKPSDLLTQTVIPSIEFGLANNGLGLAQIR
jgi:hypothetical protein